MTGIIPDKNLFRAALRCRCPRCGTGALYKGGFPHLDLVAECAQCGLKLGANDSADGPAVLLVFVLGFLLVPLALLLEFTLAPPLWVHALLWGLVALGLIVALLRPLKAYVIALQYKYRPQTLRDDDTLS